MSEDIHPLLRLLMRVIPEQASANLAATILSSDWLAQHDAEVARAAKVEALREAARSLAARLPTNCELLPDGQEDRVAAAYVEATSDAHAHLSNLADRIERGEME